MPRARGGEAVEAQQRVEPDQRAGWIPAAGRSRGRASLDAVALEPVGEQQHDRALPEHAPRPSRLKRAQRRRRCACRPTSRATAARSAASASSGSRARIARVTLVSRVPNRKVVTRRVSPSACRKCRKRRVYSLIEPEMSQSATTGGAPLLRGAIAQVDRAPPPLQRAAEGLRRGSIARPLRGRRRSGASARGRRACTSARMSLAPRRFPPRSSGRSPWRAGFPGPTR